MTERKGYIFISHSHEDRELVRNLQQGLDLQGLETWVDARRLKGGDKLQPAIKKAIEGARAFILVLGNRTINSSWVLAEVQFALRVKKKKTQSGSGEYPLIPLLLEGVEPPVLKLYFKEEPVAVKVELGPGGLNQAMPHLLAALGERSPDHIQPMLRPLAQPVDELVLELTDPTMIESDGGRRARATARLTYIPASEGEREVESRSRFNLTAPLGPIESEELRWYLEHYALWPAGVFKERAKRVEAQLPYWGNDLYNAVMNHPSAANVISAWQSTSAQTGRRFTVYVDAQLAEGAGEAEQAEANEAASRLLGLPWELLHDGRGYLFQGGRPVQVRRRLPNRIHLEGTVSEPPIRILLVSPRPEDEKAGYIDHRASALPLVTALESLGDLIQLTVLSPPTFPALQEELNRARQQGTPFQVVHFDGHGVFNRRLGLGGLCFEDPADERKPDNRRSQIIDAPYLAGVMRDHRIPLCFLAACQSARTEGDPSASVAAELLEAGVAAVVAMSHSVLVETARRFVAVFYRRLVEGDRVAEAMLSGQQVLFADPFRLKVFGAGSLNLQDWFVPVLFQEQQDLQLVTAVPSRDIQEVDQQAQEARLGDLPESPDHHFVGRSRELLRLERLLDREKYAVVCGMGGEGKTTLAVELASWLIRSRRFERGVFVCMEDVYDVRTVVDRIGRQLEPGYSVAQYKNNDLLTEALQPISRKLRDQPTLILLDNLESLLPAASGDSDPSPVEAARFDPAALETLFSLCRKLLEADSRTRLIFTSRQPLPPPFDVPRLHLRLDRLERADAVELVQRAMTDAGLTPREDDRAVTQPEITALVEAVNCHARSLVLLAPFVNQFGLHQTTEQVSALMAQLHDLYPDDRERSLFASLELSLRRLSPEIRSKIAPLGVFQGGANLVTIRFVLEIDEGESVLLAKQLKEYGLANFMDYGFIQFHPALCPYLRQELGDEALAQATIRFTKSMQQLTEVLYQQQFQNGQLSATLTILELPNLLHLLQWMQAQGNPYKTIPLAVRLESLIAQLGLPFLLQRVVKIRQEEARKIPDWCHTRFESDRLQIERLLESGDYEQALEEARSLQKRCIQAGEDAYPEALYDMAGVFFLLGRVLKLKGASQDALPYIEEAEQRFRQQADQGVPEAIRMASVILTEKGDCLRSLGRWREAKTAYEESIKIAEKLGDKRQVAVNRANMFYVLLKQGRCEDAIKEYDEARWIFSDLSESASQIVIWNQAGRAFEEAQEYEKAEQFYLKALALSVQQQDPVGEANIKNQLGILYGKMGRDRADEAISFFRQAAEKYIEIRDTANEGRVRSNIADALVELRRFGEARPEVERAIECEKTYGHASQPWKAWMVKHKLEKAEGNRQKAQEARKSAIWLYLAYRRDGGESQSPGSQFFADFRQALLTNKVEEVKTHLDQLGKNPKIDSTLKSLILTLQAILAGDRDPRLAEDPDLWYTDAAEILLLLEELAGQ